MRKKRIFVEGAFYHVTSRTNNKIQAFEGYLGQKVMLQTLQEAKKKFRFRLANFCIMPNHIHLLIRPAEGTSLSTIMHWIKLQAAKRWNRIHESQDHLWGNRYYARVIEDQREYDAVMNYIDQNPVSAKLVSTASDWEASGAYHRAHNLSELVGLDEADGEPGTVPGMVPGTIPGTKPKLSLDEASDHAGKSP